MDYIQKKIDFLQESVSAAMNTISEKQSSDSFLDSFFDPTAMMNSIELWTEQINELQLRKEELVERGCAERS